MGRRWFQYVDDYGDPHAVELDEQNTELVNSTADEAAASVPGNTLPRTITPRTVRFNSPDGLYSRSVVLLGNTAESLAAVPTSLQFVTREGAVTMLLTSYIGERQRIVTALDTRQTDGDTEIFGIQPV